MAKIDIKKKTEERQILNKIFSSSQFIIKENEPLDFLISYDNYVFGVEITRQYYNDGFGRLNNNPNYKMELERGKVHKDDYNNLKIRSTFLFLPTDNQFHFAFNSVTYTKPTEEEFTQKIIETIKSKNKKIKQYKESKAEWLELIISDENGYFNDGSLLNEENKQKIVNEVTNSIFKTVYILSHGSLRVIGKIPDFLLKDNL